MYYKKELVEITKVDYCVLGRYLKQPCRYQLIIGGEDLRYPSY
jgi:hypothetical protein